MYSPLLWRNAKGQLESIIKRRWRRRTSKMRQIYSQSTELIKHVHQNLNMSCLNGHDRLQCTTNVKVIQSRWWKNSTSTSTNRISRRLTRSSTCRRRRGCGTRRLNSRAFRALSLIWAALCLRKVAPMGAIMCTGSKARKSSKPKNNKILWMKIVWKRVWAVEELLWTSFKEWRNRWGKLIGAFVTRAYRNAHRSKGMVCRWEIGHKEWHAILKKRQVVSVSSTKVIRGSEPHRIEIPVMYDMMSSKRGGSS